MTESKNPRLSEHAVVTEEHRKWAQQVWDEIADDDECCIGNPEGSEFIEENIIPKLAQLLADRDVAQAANPRLSEEQVKAAFFSARDGGDGGKVDFAKVADAVTALIEATPAPASSLVTQVRKQAFEDSKLEILGMSWVPLVHRHEIIRNLERVLVLYPIAKVEDDPAPESQPVSAPAEKKEWITADDFLEHAYVTNDSSDGISTVECKCGITFLSQNEDSGRARKRHSDHRLIALNARLAPRIEAHIAAALGNSTCHQAMCRDELLWRASIELVEVRAALKEAEWWYERIKNYDSIFAVRGRISRLADREAELLARGGIKDGDVPRV